MSKTKRLIYIALFTAFISISAQISIPIQPIPINMSIFAILLCGAFLGRKYSVICVLTYILLGCTGIPVFTMFRGGLSTLANVTGGFIIGYIPAAYITGIVSEKSSNKIILILSMLLSVLSCYAVGVIWFCFISGNSFYTAFFSCVLPFIPTDIIKIITAFLTYNKLKRLSLFKNSLKY